MSARFKSLIVQLQLSCHNCHKTQSQNSSPDHPYCRSSIEPIYGTKTIRLVTLAVPSRKAPSARLETQPLYQASGEWRPGDPDHLDPSITNASARSGQSPFSDADEQSIIVPLAPDICTAPPGHPADIESPDNTFLPLEEYGVRRGQKSPARSNLIAPSARQTVSDSPPSNQSNRQQPRGSEQPPHRLTERNITGRGVLLDWRWYALLHGIEYSPFEKHSITVEELRTIATYSDIEFKTGDILLIRTGWTAEFIALTEFEKEMLWKSEADECCGIESSEEAAEWHRTIGFTAVVTDSRRYDAWPPPLPPERSLSDALAEQMLPVGECWDLERLSDVCARQGQWTFLISGKLWETEDGHVRLGSAMAMF